MAARVLIRGAGAIGGLPGPWLKGAGHDVARVGVVPDRVVAVEGPARGLGITGFVELMHEAAYCKRGMIDDASPELTKRSAAP